MTASSSSYCTNNKKRYRGLGQPGRWWVGGGCVLLAGTVAATGTGVASVKESETVCKVAFRWQPSPNPAHRTRHVIAHCNDFFRRQNKRRVSCAYTPSVQVDLSLKGGGVFLYRFKKDGNECLCALRRIVRATCSRLQPLPKTK